nr:hypothetical protein PJ912_01320 [Pectobacterium colocasium]
MKPIDQINSWMQEALRPYFGLEPLSSAWEIVTVRDGYFICFDGDTIRKRITRHRAKLSGRRRHYSHARP